MITNPQTKKSKGYAFIEFTNYKEFHDALNIKEPLIFGKQKLVLNSAKNRFDMEDINKNSKLFENTFIEDKKYLDPSNLLAQHHSLSSTETGFSSIRNSKESNLSGNDNGEKISDISHPLLEDKFIPKNNNNSFNHNYINKDSNNQIESEIKDSLKKMSTYYNINQNNNNSPLFNYYYSSFLDNNNKKDFSILNQNNNNYSRTIPFESYENNY